MAHYVVYCDVTVTKQMLFVAMIGVRIQCSSDFIGCCECVTMAIKQYLASCLVASSQALTSEHGQVGDFSCDTGKSTIPRRKA